MRVSFSGKSMLLRITALFVAEVQVMMKEKQVSLFLPMVAGYRFKQHGRTSCGVYRTHYAQANTPVLLGLHGGVCLKQVAIAYQVRVLGHKMWS